MLRRILYFVLVVSLPFSFSFPTPGFADKKAEQEKLEKIRKEKKQQEAEVDKAQGKLKKTKTELAKIEEKIAGIDLEIGQLNKQLAVNQTELTQKEQHVNKMIRRMYVEGDTHYMAQLFSADSLSDFLLRFETLRTLVKRETNLLTSYQNTKAEMEKARQKIEAEKKKQAPFVAAAQKKYKQIKASFKEENKALAKLEKQEEAKLKDIQELDRLAKKVSGQYNNNLGSGILGFPTTRGRVYWNYGQNRGSHMHAGIDVPRPIGTPLYAADSGIVSLTKTNPGGYGYYIIINHGNGLSTLYAHMYQSSVKVRVGQKVRKGQLIAEVGNNGRSSGPHLHFEVRKNGNPVNPRNYIN